MKYSDPNSSFNGEYVVEIYSCISDIVMSYILYSRIQRHPFLFFFQIDMIVFPGEKNQLCDCILLYVG